MHFVFDLDGTICFKGQCVSDQIADCLEQLTHVEAFLPEVLDISLQNIHKKLERLFQA